MAGRHKSVIEATDVYVLKEPGVANTAHIAPKMEVLSAENLVFPE